MIGSNPQNTVQWQLYKNKTGGLDNAKTPPYSLRKEIEHWILFISCNKSIEH